MYMIYLPFVYSSCFYNFVSHRDPLRCYEVNNSASSCWELVSLWNTHLYEKKTCKLVYQFNIPLYTKVVNEVPHPINRTMQENQCDDWDLNVFHIMNMKLEHSMLTTFMVPLPILIWVTELNLVHYHRIIIVWTVEYPKIILVARMTPSQQ